ncbi:MAG: hypothetical protein CMJ77_04470 [Planctomycetaceae bacterium]|nr:hypothetical protein [Planctomycetaceae bacterium]
MDYSAIRLGCILFGIIDLVASTGMSADWIWGPRGQSEFGLEMAVEIPPDSERVQLKAAVDSSSLTVQWNQRAWQLEAASRFVELNLSEAITNGPQHFQIAANSQGGPAAIAFELISISETGESTLLVESSESLTGRMPEKFTQSDGVHEYGRVNDEPWWNIRRKPRVSAFDEYNQWKEARQVNSANQAASFQLPDDFEIDLVFQGNGDHQSWVSMEIGPNDEIFLGNERSGIHRLSLSQDVESPEPVAINDQLRGVQGLLWADGELWASANRSKALYKLAADENGDSWAKVEKILETAGSEGDHGRHDVERDPQRKTYVIHGDSIRVPPQVTSLVPITHEFDEGVPKVGHVIRSDLSGKHWEVFCSGLRNPYGLAWNDAHELFTFDADAERHTGLPWYRPTRIIHLMAGVDYGWRHPENPWPSYLPDTVPPIAKIGRGSPTALKFGYASDFPAHYQQALFALDWSYGRVLALHVVPNGASYTGHAEVFLRGRPFSVCDLGFLSDGSMLILTGGRDTSSSIYQVRYTGVKPKSVATAQMLAREAHAQEARQRRRSIESLFEEQGGAALNVAWENLAHPDPALRSAARILLERQPVEAWHERALLEPDVDVALQALLALARVGPVENFPAISDRIQQVDWTLPRQVQIACRIESLVDEHPGEDSARSARICQQFEQHFPTRVRAVDRELSRLLINHRSDRAIDTSLELCADSQVQIDRFHYLVCLADADTGWGPERFDEYFRLLEGAQRFLTDEGLDQRIRQMYEKVLARVPAAEQESYRRLFEGDEPTLDGKHERPFQQAWTVEAVMTELRTTDHAPDRQNGKTIYLEASCGRCHRFANVGRAFGPDLTTVASRFGHRHLVEQLIAPSKTISSQYQNHQFELRDGRLITGQIVYDGFRKSILRVAMDPMDLRNTIEIQKGDIETVQPSAVSPMPARLLDTFTIQEIADLLAYLKEGPQEER